LFWELASIAPVKDTDGHITHFIGVKEDITQRKATEEQLRQSQKMEAIGQLTGGIAHDFNNLLAIIIGNLQLLQERVEANEKTGEFMADALWSAKRGAELTHRLLAFARRQPLYPEVLNLNKVIAGMTELLRRTLGANIQVREQLAADLWKALADKGGLERALVNLAVNARDAMWDGGVLTIETRSVVLDQDYAEQHEEVAPGEYTMLAVTDTGTGMSPETMKRIFEPFFTTKEVGKGSGLGLSMVYGFIKQSGGHVSVSSEVGRGTTVTLFLPRAKAPAAIPEEPPMDALGDTLENKIVLVVEDEARLRKVARKMLKKMGLQVAEADSMKEALQRIEQLQRVDILFTDLELPEGMVGAELAEEVRKLHPDIKIIYTTGYAKDTVLRNGQLRAEIPMISKPYSRSELARALKAVFTMGRDPH
jgi:nitrogen-specific signal transduction histidine kinase/CheY-like chemotaxis protein